MASALCKVSWISSFLVIQQIEPSMEKYVSPLMEILDCIQCDSVMISSPAPGGIEDVIFDDWGTGSGSSGGGLQDYDIGEWNW